MLHCSLPSLFIVDTKCEEEKRKQKSRRRCSVAGGERAGRNESAMRETHIPIRAAGGERRSWERGNERENIVSGHKGKLQCRVIN
jgi:hypothetical protein